MIIALLVSIAGGLGASARLIIDGLITSRLASRTGAQPPGRLSSFPVGTTVINVGGSLLLGLAFGLTQEELITHRWELIIGTGFLGGFTTFSTASLETVRLLGRRRWWVGAACGLGMLLCAIAAAASGFAVGGLIGGAGAR
jgi:fluoride exporter